MYGVSQATNLKKNHPFTKAEYFCGTGSISAESSCWSATYTVTVCGEYDSQAVANIHASLLAGTKRELMISLVEILNELDPCE